MEAIYILYFICREGINRMKNEAVGKTYGKKQNFDLTFGSRRQLVTQRLNTK